MGCFSSLVTMSEAIECLDWRNCSVCGLEMRESCEESALRVPQIPVDIYQNHLNCLFIGHDVIDCPTSYDVQWGAHQETPMAWVQ